MQQSTRVQSELWSPTPEQLGEMAKFIGLETHASSHEVRVAFRGSLGMDTPAWGTAGPGNPIDGLSFVHPTHAEVLAWIERND